MLVKSVMLTALILLYANPSARPSTTIPTAQPASAQATISAPGNTPTVVDVKTLPPVTVQPTKKDWADWGYWAFGGFLVIVGFIQVALLFQTVKVSQDQRSLMGRQADLMTRQADLMERQASSLEKSISVAEKSARAARDSAKAAVSTARDMRSTARRELRARVSVASAKRLGAASPGSYQAEITVKNFGHVTAYKCTCVVGLALRLNDSNDEYPAPRIVGDEPHMPLPPGGEFTMVRHLELGTFDSRQHSDVMAGTRAVYFTARSHIGMGFNRVVTPNFG